MPANTVNGLPYPLGTDRVMDGDDAIHALADGLKIAHGYVDIAVTTVTLTSATVTLPAGLFAAAGAPVVTASFNAASVIANFQPIGISNLSNTSIRINVQRGSGSGTIRVYWVAFAVGNQQTPAPGR